MSDTPRTDAAAVDVWRGSDGRRRELPSDMVPVDFARELERELAELTKQRDSLVEDVRCALAVGQVVGGSKLDLSAAIKPRSVE